MEGELSYARFVTWDLVDFGMVIWTVEQRGGELEKGRASRCGWSFHKQLDRYVRRALWFDVGIGVRVW